MGKPYIDFAAIKAAVTMPQVLEHYGLMSVMRSVKNGEALEGPCPIHNGTSPDQFKVSIPKNCWNCFGSECKCGGNVLDFVSRMEECNAHEAAIRMNSWFSLNLDQPSNAPLSKRSARSEVRPNHQQSIAPTARRESPLQEDQLREPEGFTQAKAKATEAPQVLVPNKPLTFALKNLQPNYDYFIERGLTPETVSEFGLGYCSKGTMAGRVVIPIHHFADSALVGYAGRLPGPPSEERPKYKFPKGFQKMVEVFNLHRVLALPEPKPIIVVEGFFDVMKLWQLGWRHVVSIMGSSLSDTQENALLKASSQMGGLILLFDEDDAGRYGRDKALWRLARKSFVRVVPLPKEGQQPDHLSVDELREVLS